MNYKVSVPEGKSGAWEVKKFVVPENNFQQWKYGRGVSPGEYTGLYRNGAIIMSDTRDEYRDHSYFINTAKGRVLVAGLGIGMVTKCLLEKPEVTEVVVIEQSEDVIKLVAPVYQHPKCKIIQADIFEFEPEGKFDCAWFDIWDDLCTDNLKEMTKLKRKFGKSVKEKGCWGEELLRRRNRREDKEEKRWAPFNRALKKAG